jgi:transcriptional regulator with GAF, ATPase, and Fis domain
VSHFEVYAISESQAQKIPLGSLTPVGGRESSGVVLEGLKSASDYAILAPSPEGIVIHPLRGNARHPQTVALHETCRIEDLTILVIAKAEVSAGKASGNSDIPLLQQVLGQMAEPQNTRKPLTQVLSVIMQVAQHEKGLIISKNISGEFEILVSSNVEANESWISENLVQNVLKEKKPAFVQNIIGSSYHSSQSLISTGFLSVFCWPLIVQGTTIGVLLTGSRRPHSGLSTTDTLRIETFVNLAAMIANFRLRELSLQREIEQLREKRADTPFQTQSAKLKATCDLAVQVADSDLAILVQGETGVGKEVMARWLHDQSARKGGPFVAVNCGAIPSELLESLLFGHKKGAFTHAFNDQMGKIQQAHNGTLFLDEIGDLPLALQPKLLRVLSDKMVEPLGSNKPVQVNVRLLTATHKSLKQLVAEKLFREDLYYRVAEMTLWIPPLRERPTDILLIAEQWLKEMDAQKRFSEDAREWLLGQAWKGNVRELKSVIKRAVVLSTADEIKKYHFTAGGGGEAESSPALSAEQEWLGAENLEKAKQQFVLRKIHQALELTAGNRTRAAQLLGVTARTLFRYLEEDLKDLSH